ncbi:hypothetical protein [Microbacterium aurum]
MSTETIAVVISAATLMLSFFACFGWMVQRIDRVEQRLEQRLGERIDRVEHELVEVKIAVARIEGPPRRLVTER